MFDLILWEDWFLRFFYFLDVLFNNKECNFGILNWIFEDLGNFLLAWLLIQCLFNLCDLCYISADKIVTS